MRNRVFAVTLLVCAAAMSPPVASYFSTLASAAPATPTAEAIATRVQAFYDQTKTFQAGFKQEYFIRMHDQRRTSEGRVAFEKPGKMSWKYDQPNGNRVVSDGRTLKVYDRENQQMFEQPVDKSQYPAALAFLMGQGELMRSFTLRLLDPATVKFEGDHRHRDRVEPLGRLLDVLRIPALADLGEDGRELGHAVEPPARRREQELATEHGGDRLLRMGCEHDPAARRGERRRRRPDVRREPDRLRRLLERDVQRLAAVEDGKRDGLVVTGEELGGDRPEGDDDRELRRRRPEAERPDPEVEATVVIAHGPAALDEHGADAVQGALRDAKLARELR